MDSSTDLRCRRLAAKCFAEQMDQLHAQLKGIRQARDVECVHQARVASRRLRAALTVFRDFLPPKQAKRWRRAVRRLTQALGQARDCDVQIEFLAERLAAVSSTRPCHGLAVLLAEVDRERAACQPILLQQIDRFDRGATAADMRVFARESLEGGSEPSTDGDGLALVGWAESAIGEKISALLAFEDCLSRPNDIEEHHAMRIAAKRLRYTMELVSPEFGGRLDSRIETTKQLQALLGVLHDCDVWVDRLAAFQRQFRKRRKRRYQGARGRGPWQAGLKYLRRSCRKRRRRVFEKLAARWPEYRKAVCGSEPKEPQTTPRPAVAAGRDAATSWPETILE
ncbi:MAG: CHAD domain-containing protein [Pirellulales bacterium]|nr:CHAD domain-containing protein [Pirellulales bacterium]